MFGPDLKKFGLWEDRGRRAGANVLSGLEDGRVVERIAASCVQRNERLTILGLNPIHVDGENGQRIAFEVFFYADSLLGEAARSLTTRRGLFGSKWDKLSFAAFANAGRGIFDRYMRQRQIDRVRKMEPKSLPTHPSGVLEFQPSDRTQSLIVHVTEAHPYAEARRHEHALGVPYGFGERVFGYRVACAVQAPRIEEIAPVGVAFASEILHIVAKSIECAMEDKPFPRAVQSEELRKPLSDYDDFPPGVPGSF